MNSDIFHKFGIWKENGKFAFRKKASVFGFFLILSVVFWIMNVLSRNYTTDIFYPVRYLNIPQQKAQIGNPPDKLTLRVNAQGFTLLRYKLSSKYLPLSFNLNAFTMYRSPGRDSSEFFLQTEYARDYIRNQLSSGFQVISIEPDTLYFRFAIIKSKNVPVIPAFSYQLAKQMILKNSPSIMPDSVFISGPDFMVDTLSGIETEHTDLGMISRSKEFSVKLMQVKNVSFKPENVRVSLDAEQFTEKTIQVPVTAVNLPQGLTLRTFPQNIQLTCQVGLSNYEKVQSGSFKAQVNYLEINGSENGKLRIEVFKQPEFVRAVKFTPKTVEYLIEKQ